MKMQIIGCLLDAWLCGLIVCWQLARHLECAALLLADMQQPVHMAPFR